MITAKKCAAFVFFMLINTECSKAELSCPPPVLRKSVANKSCLVERNYHCLEMYPTTVHQQGCRLPNRLAKGKYPIFDGPSKYISRIDCTQDRYQPQPSFSYEINKCIYVKSLCSEEGQVINSNGSTTEDSSCRCDYTKGYNFVIKPNERCYCIPSVEDCTCYRQRCPNEYPVLSPDYECIISMNSAVFTCPKIESINGQEDNHIKTVTVILSEIHGHRPVRNLSNLTAGMILMVLLILFLPLYGILIHIIINNWYKLCLVQRFVSDLKDRTCNEGDSVTFSCEVTDKTAKVKWYKDGLRLQQSRNHKIESHDGLHTFRIVKTSDMYRGTYCVKTRGKVSRSAELEFTDIPVQIEKFVETEQKKSVESDQKLFVEIEPQKSVDLVQTNFVETDPKKSVDSYQKKSVESNQQFVETDPKKSVKSDRNKSVESYPKRSLESDLKQSVESDLKQSVESDLEEHGGGKLNSSYVEEEDKNDESLDLTSIKSFADINTTGEKSGDRNYSTNEATTENKQTGGTVQLHTQPESDQGPGEGVPEKGSNQVQRFVSDLEDITCNEGDSVTFSCKVTNKTVEVKWYKDGLRLQQSTNHQIKSHDGIHTFTIVKTSDMYRGTYSVRTRGKESRSAKLEFTDESEKQQMAIGGTIPVDPQETATTESKLFAETVHIQQESDQGQREGVQEKLSNKDINDAVIFCTLGDERTAEEFIKHVQQLEIEIEDLRLVLHREVMEPGIFSLEKFEGLFDTNRFIFLFVTQQFKSSKTVSYIGDALLQESLMKQNKFLRVIPVSVDGPEYMPFSLQSLIPINYYHYKQLKDQKKEDKIYVKTLARLFNIGRKQHLPI